MNEPARCPVCPDAMKLALWRSERVDAAVHYCGGCCGAWVERGVGDVLGLNAGADLLPLWIGPPLLSDRPGRACPACAAPMDRKACGQVVVDVCTSHGIWLDCEELEHFVRWLRDRAEAHRRSIGAPVALGASAIPIGDRDWCVGAGGEWDGGLAIELIMGVFDAWP